MVVIVLLYYYTSIVLVVIVHYTSNITIIINYIPVCFVTTTYRIVLMTTINILAPTPISSPISSLIMSVAINTINQTNYKKIIIQKLFRRQ